MEMSDDDLGRKLSAATDSVLGQLSPAGPRGSFPLQARHAKQYVLPGLALVLTLSALNSLGDALRDALDPRLAQARS